jgi:CheY-like chemotaxis protein
MPIRNIYMADDDPDDYYLFSTVLKEVNDAVKLTWFSSGNDLINDLCADNNRLPDLILLDMNMPRKDGLECLQKIKQQETLCRIPIVILSTASSPFAIKKAYECGAVKYLLKPHSIDDITKMIREILAIDHNH